MASVEERLRVHIRGSYGRSLPTDVIELRFDDTRPLELQLWYDDAFELVFARDLLHAALRRLRRKETFFLGERWGNIQLKPLGGSWGFRLLYLRIVGRSDTYEIAVERHSLVSFMSRTAGLVPYGRESAYYAARMDDCINRILSESDDGGDT